MNSLRLMEYECIMSPKERESCYFFFTVFLIFGMHACKRKATVAEKFDSYVISRFYDLLSLGMFYRCVKSTNNEKVEEEISQRITRWNKELEKQLSYKVIPIRSLVKVQLGSALLTAEYIGKKS